MKEVGERSGMSWLALIGTVLVVELIGNIGSLATFRQITTWYAELTKPAFNPPSWLFGPVWTVLFASMGIAVYLVWRKGFDNELVRRAIGLFGIQLALNVLWSFVFFGWHQPFLAWLEIIVLWVAIVITIRMFQKVSLLAAWLMVPYAVWVAFAALLNFMVWKLN